MQDAAASTRSAADRTREADLRAAEQVVDSLRGLAGDLGAMGRRLFSAFEARSPANPTPRPMEAQPQPEEAIVQRRGALETHDNQPQLQQPPSEPVVCSTEYAAPFIVDSGSDHSWQAASAEPKPNTDEGPR